jgi:hypothetical protein
MHGSVYYSHTDYNYSANIASGRGKRSDLAVGGEDIDTRLQNLIARLRELRAQRPLDRCNRVSLSRARQTIERKYRSV